MFCKECGETLEDTVKFCSKCGARQSEKLANETIPKDTKSKESSDLPLKQEKETPKITNNTIPSSSKPKCPYCGSQKLRIEKKPFRKGMLFLGVLGAVIEANRNKGKQFVCQNCGETWDVD